MNNKVKQEIQAEIQRLHKLKAEAMNQGDRATYQNCCNKLSGISFVTERLK